ncbi:hypothetical protein HG530_015417 [Fusarium avenaceum]|nr:hypothetical protein HG530_015417 [Fusarium avenaceum]
MSPLCCGRRGDPGIELDCIESFSFLARVRRFLGGIFKILVFIFVVGVSNIVTIVINIRHVYQGEVRVAFGLHIFIDVTIIEDNNTAFTRIEYPGDLAPIDSRRTP